MENEERTHVLQNFIFSFKQDREELLIWYRLNFGYKFLFPDALERKKIVFEKSQNWPYHHS